MERRNEILLVEDEPTIADAIRFSLTQEGFQVNSAGTLGAALKALESSSPDLIILDVGLPDGNGFEFCRELRKSSEVPVIFLTARADEVDRIVGLELGADDYMVKPFSPRELAARARAILRRTSPIERSHAPGGLICHSEAYDFSFDAIPMKLTRYEFRLLSTLFASPGRVYTREQLMNFGWEEPEMSLERTVDAHVKSIRGKLRALGADPELIVTHRGIGYSFRKDP